MRIRKKWLSLFALVAMAGALGVVPAQADHNASQHSPNAKLLARKRIKVDKDVFARGSDLAFQKNLIVAGTYEGTAFFKRLRRAPYIRQVGFHKCPGSQGDVSIWGNYVFVSIDSPASNNVESPTCNNTDNSLRQEGIRIIDISDLQRPKQVQFIPTYCGSHTNVLVPHGEKMYIYVNSYPLGLPTPTCNQAQRKFSIIEMPMNRPRQAKVIDFPGPVKDPSIGCHDTTVFPRRDIAVAACLQNTIILNIKNPAKPTVLSTIVNREIQFHHSSSFTWDGKYAIISDEYLGAAGGGGCAGDEDSKIGAMWFYNIEDPKNPRLDGSYSLPRVPDADSPEEGERFRCTTHLYNILPTKDRSRYVAVSSYYAGGISAVDFSEPSRPVELAYYVDSPGGVLPDSWSAYWYNNRVYSNDHSSRQGLRVFKLRAYTKGPLVGFGKRRVLNFGPRYNPQVQRPGDLYNASRRHR